MVKNHTIKIYCNFIDKELYILQNDFSKLDNKLKKILITYLKYHFYHDYDLIIVKDLKDILTFSNCYTIIEIESIEKYLRKLSYGF